MVKKKKIYIFIFVTLIAISINECSKNKNKVVTIKSKNKISFNKRESIAERKEFKKSIKNNENKKIEKENIIWENNKKYKLYIVKAGDTVWSIAEDYVKEIKGKNYTQKDIGNMFYLINKINFSKYPGGVKNKLKVGEKILLPSVDN